MLPSRSRVLLLRTPACRPTVSDRSTVVLAGEIATAFASIMATGEQGFPRSPGTTGGLSHALQLCLRVERTHPVAARLPRRTGRDGRRRRRAGSDGGPGRRAGARTQARPAHL